ncbi:unnamed protein product [Hermetia illucens]|uniref:Odorant receptor n=1 Tax=Hermetia illucens TaxID=343691 RepID=A0A7R8UHT2_HERIL|nr:odorant receptor 63a-like isoform X2 [Hermetia illucens]CAD7080287.1 unnamed protein product [Hermetia illucens]
MESLEQYDKICQWLYAVAKVVGIDFFRNNVWNCRIIICISAIVLASISVLYTIYIVRHDFTLLLKCIGASMIAITGVAKLYSTVKTQKRQESLLIFVRKLYIVNIEGSARRKTIMQTSTEKYFTTMKRATALFVFIILIVAVYPAYSFFYLNKVELFFEIQFIGHPMSQASAKIYIVNYISQFVDIFLGYIGNILHDVIFCTFVFYVYTLIELQKAAFDETQEFIGIDRYAFEKILKNCMIMTQDTNNYISEINSLYSFVVFVQIAASSVAMALHLFCSVTTDWLGAYGFVLFNFIQIFVYCLIGTFLEIMSDEVVNTIYQFPWYSTTKENRKLLCFTLMKAQKMTKLKIVGVADLNVNTAAIIYRTIYSYLMMLLSFAE